MVPCGRRVCRSSCRNGVKSDSVRRREALVPGVFSIAFGVAGCPPGVLRNKRKRRCVSTSGLTRSHLLRPDVHAEFLASDRWMVDVVLGTTRLRNQWRRLCDAYTKVRNLARLTR